MWLRTPFKGLSLFSYLRSKENVSGNNIKLFVVINALYDACCV